MANPYPEVPAEAKTFNDLVGWAAENGQATSMKAFMDAAQAGDWSSARDAVVKMEDWAETAGKADALGNAFDTLELLDKGLQIKEMVDRGDYEGAAIQFGAEAVDKVASQYLDNLGPGGMLINYAAHEAGETASVYMEEAVKFESEAGAANASADNAVVMAYKNNKEYMDSQIQQQLEAGRPIDEVQAWTRDHMESHGAIYNNLNHMENQQLGEAFDNRFEKDLDWAETRSEAVADAIEKREEIPADADTASLFEMGSTILGSLSNIGGNVMDSVTGLFTGGNKDDEDASTADPEETSEADPESDPETQAKTEPEPDTTEPVEVTQQDPGVPEAQTAPESSPEPTPAPEPTVATTPDRAPAEQNINVNVNVNVEADIDADIDVAVVRADSHDPGVVIEAEQVTIDQRDTDQIDPAQQDPAQSDPREVTAIEIPLEPEGVIPDQSNDAPPLPTEVVVDDSPMTETEKLDAYVSQMAREAEAEWAEEALAGQEPPVPTEVVVVDASEDVIEVTDAQADIADPFDESTISENYDDQPEDDHYLA